MKTINRGKSSTKTKKGLKSKKALVAVGLVSILALAGVGTSQVLISQKTRQQSQVQSYQLSTVTPGSVASSTLLTGTVKASGEQTVYYDSSKGTVASVNVAVGDTVQVGQSLVQYDTTTAQATYDTAVRNYNKVLRQIQEFKKSGTTSTTTSSDSSSDSSSSTTSSATSLADLNDSLADAQSEVNKAKTALDSLTVTSNVSGTVVAVNTSIDTSKSTSQTIVHVVTEGQLEIEGTLTQYDLAKVASGSQVNITSNVYSDQTWTGQVSYVSNYPTDSSTSADSTSSTSSSSTTSTSAYPYKVSFTGGDTSLLKQGFKVSVEVLSNETSLIVPVSAVTTEDDKSYVWVYDQESKTVKKTEVTLGSADATNQVITSGLSEGQIVVTTADDSLTDGASITVQETSASAESQSIEEASSSS